MQARKKEDSCLLKGCLGCFGISALILILLIVFIIGGAYWFYKNRLLQDEPAYTTTKELSSSEVTELNQKLRATESPTAERNSIVLNESELTHLVNLKLSDSKTMLDLGIEETDSLDIAAVDISLPEEQMDIKLSFKLGSRFMNLRLKGVPKIVNNDLIFNTSNFTFNNFTLNNNTVLKNVDEQMNIEINNALKKYNLDQYVSQVQNISIDRGKLILDFKEKSY
ncbi:hypothetical protein GF337_01965 [candidate division KSB1 bacterium]|nr:hypothetical protein [candidate division KSB1 bacterium]